MARPKNIQTRPDRQNTQSSPLELSIPLIPDGFILAQDTREQLPLFCPHRLAKGELYWWKDKVPVVGQKLDDGDYSVVGMEQFVCVELKRWSDFLSYAGKERVLKTIPKLERMSRMDFAALVINECYDDLWYPQMFSFSTGMTTNGVRGFLKSVNVRYGVHVYASASAELCRMWILDRLTWAYKTANEKEKI